MLAQQETHRKKKLTFMVVPHGGQKIKSIEISKTAFTIIAVVFALALFSAIFFPYKYFVALAKNSRDDSYRAAQKEQYGVLSEELREASDASAVFSAELGKTGSLLNIPKRDDGLQEAPEGDFSRALYVNTRQLADAEQNESLLTISEQLDKSIPVLQDVNASLAKQTALMQQLPVYWPVPDSSVSAEWGPTVHPVYGYWYIHRGLDIAAPSGTPVYAVAEGVVTDISFDRHKGLNVFISHKYGFKTRYSHLGSIEVSKGQTVKQGARVGSVGVTGMTLEPHLDLQLYLGEDVIDPGIYLRRLDAEQYADASATARQ